MQREEFIVSCTKAEWEGCEKALRVRSWVRRLWEGTDRCRINSRQWDICNLNSYSSYRPRIVAVTAVLPAVLLAHAPFQPTLPLSPHKWTLKPAAGKISCILPNSLLVPWKGGIAEPPEHSALWQPSFWGIGTAVLWFESNERREGFHFYQTYFLISVLSFIRDYMIYLWRSR